MRNESIKFGEYIVVVPLIDKMLSRQVAGFCRLIWKQNSKGELPYGFSVPGNWFDLDGSLKIDCQFTGLTCAALVLSIYYRLGIHLVLSDTWKVRDDDKEFQRMWIEQYLPNAGAEKRYVEKVGKQLGNIRIRPEEVAGAALEAPPPVDFDKAVKLSMKIKEELNTLTKKI